MTNKLLFRLCEAVDGRRFAILTEQTKVEESFDNGCKMAYQDMAGSYHGASLAQWQSEYRVTSVSFDIMDADEQNDAELLTHFNRMVSSLLKGVDVFFCPHRLAIGTGLAPCGEMMELYKSTDFIIFSCVEIAGYESQADPQMVTYALPRYQAGARIAKQHRIYCKTDSFAFCQAVSAIVLQRKKDNLMGGHIRGELTPYIAERPIDRQTATQAINYFVQSFNGVNC